MTVGILALQGAFVEHAAALGRIGVESVEIRNRQDLDRSFDRLILPGGESTAMLKLLNEQDMLEPLRQKIADGMPTLGTCAGLILLGQRIVGGTPGFATLNAVVRRNAYGRQLGSFTTRAPFADRKVIPMTFIRAPMIEEVGSDVEILAQVNGTVVAVRQDRQMGVCFHPELSDDPTVHQMFMQL